MARKRCGTRHLAAKVLFFLMLEVGALAGIPMRPDQLVELGRMMRGEEAVEVVRRADDGEPPDPPP